jgi:hypothetical protein
MSRMLFETCSGSVSVDGIAHFAAHVGSGDVGHVDTRYSMQHFINPISSFMVPFCP